MMELNERTSLLTLYRDGEVNHIPPPEWLVEDLVPARKLVQMYGPEGSLKTFLALSIGYAVAHGHDWAGKEVKQGAVVHLYMEGGDSIRVRREAWKRANGISVEDDADIFFIPEVINLMDREGYELAALSDSITARLGEAQPVLIVIDTLSRAFGEADPSSWAEMNTLVARCDQLKERFRATVLLVHHTGWDEKREAGARSLRNACDTIISVSKVGSKHSLKVRLGVDKQKGSAPVEPLELRLEEVELSDGSTSLALPASASAEEVIELGKEVNTLHMLAQLGSAPFSTWERACEAAGGARDKTFKRHRQRLVERGLVTPPPEEDSKGYEYRITPAGWQALEDAAMVPQPSHDSNLTLGPPSFDSLLGSRAPWNARGPSSGQSRGESNSPW